MFIVVTQVCPMVYVHRFIVSFYCGYQTVNSSYEYMLYIDENALRLRY